MEVEILPEGVVGENKWGVCEKYPGHKDFIPVSDFTTEHLPEAYRSSEYLELIKLMSKLTVRLRVQYTSIFRPDDDPFAKYRGTRATRTGTGFIARDDMRDGRKCYIFYPFFENDPIKDTAGDDKSKITEPILETDKLDFLKSSLNKFVRDCGGDSNILLDYDNDSFFSILYRIKFTYYHYVLTEDDRCIDDWLQRVKDNTDILFEKGEKNISSFKTVWRQRMTNYKVKKHENMTKQAEGGSETLSEKAAADDELDPYFTSKVHSCPCQECKISSTPYPTGYLLFVRTARHVIFDNKEAMSTVVDLFFDDKSGKGVENIYPVQMCAHDPKSDNSIILCVTHNDSLVRKLQELSQKFVENRMKIGTNTKPALAIICSHPHGCFKHITVGEWTKRWLYFCEPIEEIICTSYMYETPTCPGSSGAPVLLFGQKDGTKKLYHILQIHFGVEIDKEANEKNNSSGPSMGIIYDEELAKIPNLRSDLRKFFPAI